MFSNIIFTILQFFSTFEVEDAIEPMVVVPGYNYFAQLRFTSVPQNSVEELVGIACNPNKDYNKLNCMVGYHILEIHSGKLS